MRPVLGRELVLAAYGAGVYGLCTASPGSEEATAEGAGI